MLSQLARLIAISTVYRLPALNRPEQPPFYNGVAEIDTQHPPLELKFEVLRKIEDALHRRRSADKYAARTIDLDLLLHDQCVMESPELVLPDPVILTRPFVAFPLHELAPDLILPGSGSSLRDVVARLSAAEMEPMLQYTKTLRDTLLH